MEKSKRGIVQESYSMKKILLMKPSMTDKPRRGNTAVTPGRKENIYKNFN